MRLETFFTLWIVCGCFAQDVSNNVLENVLKEIQLLKTENANKASQIKTLQEKNNYLQYASQELLVKIENVSDKVDTLKDQANATKHQIEGHADKIENIIKNSRVSFWLVSTRKNYSSVFF